MSSKAVQELADEVEAYERWADAVEKERAARLAKIEALRRKVRTPPRKPVAVEAIMVGTSTPATVEAAIRTLNAKKPGVAIAIGSLRGQLAHMKRPEVDAELMRLQRESKIALYRNDNTMKLSEGEKAAALLVGGEPRHLVYWRG